MRFGADHPIIGNAIGIMSVLDEWVAGYVQGLLAERPAMPDPEYRGFLFFAADKRKASYCDGERWHNISRPSITLGPFLAGHLPANGTTQAALGAFTASGPHPANDVKVQADAHVTGLFVVSDAARTQGTATVRIRLDGKGTDFAAGVVALDAANPTSDSLVTDDGVAVRAGQTVGAEIVTSSFAPVGASVQVFLVLEYD